MEVCSARAKTVIDLDRDRRRPATASRRRNRTTAENRPAHNNTIDLTESTIPEEKGSSPSDPPHPMTMDRTPDPLSPVNGTPPPSRPRAAQPSRRKRNRPADGSARKRRRAAASGDPAGAPPSSPFSTPARRTRAERERKRQESLLKARGWRDGALGGRGAPGKAAAAAKGRFAVGVSSPKSPIRNGRGRASREVPSAATTTPKKMSRSEKQAARARACEWSQNRRAKNGSAGIKRPKEEAELVSLSSPSPHSPPLGIVNHQGQGRPPNDVPSAAVGRGAQQHRAFEMMEAAMGMLYQQPTSNAASSVAADARGRESQREASQQWACPACTLLNNQNQLVCEACHHDPSLLQTSPVVFGRASNDQRIAQRLSNDRAFGSAARTTASTAGTSHANRQSIEGSGAMPFINESATGGLMARGTISPSHTSSRGNGWGMPSRVFNSSSSVSQFLQSMPNNSNTFRQLQGVGENVDDMSYERLLEVFGNGGENRGASSRVIASLPVSRIGNPEHDLPESMRECSICLDDFCQNNERTTLPCLHGFHTTCVNRWLTTNGTCPVCKTSVSKS